MYTLYSECIMCGGGSSYQQLQGNTTNVEPIRKHDASNDYTRTDQSMKELSVHMTDSVSVCPILCMIIIIMYLNCKVFHIIHLANVMNDAIELFHLILRLLILGYHIIVIDIMLWLLSTVWMDCAK